MEARTQPPNARIRNSSNYDIRERDGAVYEKGNSEMTHGGKRIKVKTWQPYSHIIVPEGGRQLGLEETK